MDESSMAGELRLGKVRLYSYEVFGMLGCSLFCLFAWLCFGYGFCDPADGGAGYLQTAIPVSFAMLFVACLASFFDFKLLEMLKRSQAFTLFAGVACSATAMFLPAFSPFSVTDEMRTVLAVMNMCALSWCVFICLHTVSESKSVFKLCVIAHLVIPTMFVLNGMFFVFSRFWSLVLFAVVPVIGSAMLVLAARLSPCLRCENAREFWFMPSRLAHSFDACGKMDVSALVGPRYASVRKLLVMALVSVFVVSFYIAFVRYAVLQGSSGIESHSVGASGGLGLMAIVAMVMLSVALTTGRYEGMHVYYVVGCLGMCFAALVVLLTSDSNQPLVRTIENASFILYVMSMTYAFASWVATINIYVSNLMALVGAVASVGTVAGWLCQGALFAFVDAEYMLRISFFAATFAVLAYVLFGFTAQEYKRFVGLGVSFQKAEQFAAARGGAGQVPIVWHDCRDLLAQAANIEAAQAESNPGQCTGRTAPLAACATVKAEPPAAVANVLAEQAGPLQAVTSVAEESGCKGPALEGAAVEGLQAAKESLAEGLAAGEPAGGDPADEAGASARRAPRHGISFREAVQESAQKAGLSKREVSVLSMLLKGYSDQRIAEELVLSYHTVRSHVRHIYAKMGVHSREEISDYINAVQNAHAPSK